MFNIDVIDAGISKRIYHQPGNSLLETLRGADIKIRTGCQKNGACALCKVMIREGKAGPITVTEELQLEHWLTKGMRLACQVMPEGDLVIDLIPQGESVIPASKSIEIKSEYLSGEQPRGDAPEKGYGIAIDIGTTNVNVSIFQWENGKQLATQTFSNPQREYGTDVIARVLKASEDVSIAKELQNMLLHQIKEALQELVQTADIGLEDITGIGVVGNTAMLALFSNCSYQQLLDAKCWDKTLTFSERNKECMIDFFQVDQHAHIKVIDPLASFVGSDLLSGITAIRLLDKEPGTLFVDFGTNTEIAFWDGEAVWVTAAAGGPAFEGCGMSCGSAAVPGAIFQVQPSDGPEICFKALSIEGKDAVGICGSGYVDIISALLTMNIVDSIGRWKGTTIEGQEIAIMDHPLIRVTKKDIDMFQRAKGAVAAGIRVLLHRAGMSSTDINHIYIAGNFGQFLDITNAQRIGLLPSIDPARIYLCGNTALRGCADILLYEAANEMLMAAKKRANYINLAFDPDFEPIFMESLYLKAY